MMATGSTGSPWNIPVPVGGDRYALTDDLTDMGSQISASLTQVDSKADGKADNNHTHVPADVTGLPEALAGKAGTAHAHQIGDIAGLQAVLDALTRDTGWRDITSSLTNGWTASYVHIRRIGARVILRTNSLSGQESSSITFLSLTTGFAEPRSQIPLTINLNAVTGQVSAGLTISVNSTVQNLPVNTYADNYSGWDVPGLDFPTTYPGSNV